MNWRAAVVLIAASAILPTTATAQSQPRTRASDMRVFVPAFWQTMPEVSPLCRTIVDEVMYAIAGQLHAWDADAYNLVLKRSKVLLISEPVTTNREVISQLDWLECRELVLWGLDNRQPTQHELPGIRQAEVREAERQRLEAEWKAERKRRLETGKRFADSCEAQGGFVAKWNAYLSGRIDQPECRGLEAARERARKGQECVSGGGVWGNTSRTGIIYRCRCPGTNATWSSNLWNTSLKRCETYDARHERQAKERCREAQGTWDPSHKRHGPCITPKERRLDEWDRQQAEENERVRREREQAKAEKRRKLEERRRQLSGG